VAFCRFWFIFYLIGDFLERVWGISTFFAERVEGGILILTYDPLCKEPSPSASQPLSFGAAAREKPGMVKEKKGGRERESCYMEI
jgi:hypothetical protein